MNLFDENRPSNGFDNLQVDLGRVYQRTPLGTPRSEGTMWQNPFLRLYQSPLLPLSAQRYAWTALRRSRLDQTWFERFRVYWAQVLGGRPLWGLEDFYFLRQLYRMRFQAVDLPETEDASVHLEAWQRPELLHHLFHSVYAESLFHSLNVVQQLRSARGSIGSMLEFGCGCAPVTTTLFEFFPWAREVDVFLADIETIAFHYADWKFAEFPKVRAVPLQAAENFRIRLPQKVDAIFCMAVFEHLNEPLETVKALHALLNPNGVLIFDYVLSEAGGLDTLQGLRERPAVLEFIAQNFRIAGERLDSSRSVVPTAAVRL